MRVRDDRRRHVEALLKEVASLRRPLAEREARIVAMEERNAELQRESKRRGNRYRPKANAKQPSKKTPDRRTKPPRRHGGGNRSNRGAPPRSPRSKA